MNAEIVNMAELVIYAKHKIKSTNIFGFNKKIENLVIMDDLDMSFEFLDGTKVDSPKMWVKKLKKKKINDLFFYPKMEGVNLKNLGFANGVPAVIPCFYNNSLTTVWNKNWIFSKEENKWSVEYKESEWPGGPKERLHIDNPMQDLAKSILSIKDFSNKIGCYEWADFYDKSLEFVNIDKIKENKAFSKLIGIIPDENLAIYSVALSAFGFGAMGSWNDYPSAAASQMKLGKEYDKVSDNLYCNIVAAIMFAVSEW